MVEDVKIRLDTQEAQDGIGSLTEALVELRDTVEEISAWDLGGVAEELNVIAEDLGQIEALLSGGPDGGTWVSTLSDMVSLGGVLGEVFSTVVGALGGSGAILKSFKDFLSNIFGAEGVLAGLSPGMIAGIAAAVVLAATVIAQNLDVITARVTKIWDEHLKPLIDGVTGACVSIGEDLVALWDGVLQPVVDRVVSVFAPLILTAVHLIANVYELMISRMSDVGVGFAKMLTGIVDLLLNVFLGDWESTWNVLLTGINLLIGVLYSVIGGVIDFFNGIASVAGDIVGEDWSFPVPVDPPQIPLLARGAVLPANRPFLAMVGDQRHGTNVEAPLATIQEAVALVMGDQVAAMMTGFREVLREQQALRAAVEGIEVGDEVIGRAAARYGERMAVVRGGA